MKTKEPKVLGRYRAKPSKTNPVDGCSVISKSKHVCCGTVLNEICSTEQGSPRSSFYVNRCISVKTCGKNDFHISAPIILNVDL